MNTYFYENVKHNNVLFSIVQNCFSYRTIVARAVEYFWRTPFVIWTKAKFISYQRGKKSLKRTYSKPFSEDTRLQRFGYSFINGFLL